MGEVMLSVPDLPETLTSVTLTHVYISQMWGSKVGQQPTCHHMPPMITALIYSHLPQPLIDGSHLINATAVQGLLTCPIDTSSLSQGVALQLEVPQKPTVLQRMGNGLHTAALILFQKAKEGNAKFRMGRRIEVGKKVLVWGEWFISVAGHLIIT